MRISECTNVKPTRLLRTCRQAGGRRVFLVETEVTGVMDADAAAQHGLQAPDLRQSPVLCAQPRQRLVAEHLQEWNAMGWNVMEWNGGMSLVTPDADPVSQLRPVGCSACACGPQRLQCRLYSQGW